MASTASELDAADPLAPLRQRFVDPGASELVAYLDGNSLGRPLRATAQRMTAFVTEEWGGRLIRGWDERWMTAPTDVGDRLAEVVLGAAAGQTVVADSTSVLLYKLVRAAISAQPGRDELVVGAHDFPTDRFVLEGIAAETGTRLRWFDSPDGAVTPEVLGPVLSDRTAVVVLSHVAYRSGFLADAPGLTALVHEHGAMVLWDLCHSAGAVPVALDDWGVDLAVGCTYKYLNGGPGSPAFAYVAERHQRELVQPIQGWMGAASPFDMTDPFRPADGIRRMLSGTPPVLAMQPMRDMLELIAEVGVEAVRAKSLRLTDLALRLSDARLAPLGVTVSTPRDPERRGSHLTLEHPGFREVTAALWRRGVLPDFRPPTGLRLGLSPLSTSFAEVETAIEAIRDELVSVSPARAGAARDARRS